MEEHLCYNKRDVLSSDKLLVFGFEVSPNFCHSGRSKNLSKLKSMKTDKKWKYRLKNVLSLSATHFHCQSFSAIALIKLGSFEFKTSMHHCVAKRQNGILKRGRQCRTASSKSNYLCLSETIPAFKGFKHFFHICACLREFNCSKTSRFSGYERP